jgi:hypothetical protein
MPLIHKARRIMRINLEKIAGGQQPKVIVVGTLTPDQLKGINQNLVIQKRPQMIEEIVFKGLHIYRSRIIKDGYTIEDVLDQIYSGMDEIAEVTTNPHLTVIQNPRPRADKYGNQVRDLIVFECTDRHPRLELYSVIPKGDKNKPKK